MKKNYYKLLYAFLLACCSLLGCEDHSVLHPAFIEEKEDDRVWLDFTYRKSTQYYGFVKFQLSSQNIATYRWTFGFQDKDGNLVTSNSSSPGIIFPSNGTYTVTLKGEDLRLNPIEVIKNITITNFP